MAQNIRKPGHRVHAKCHSWGCSHLEQGWIFQVSCSAGVSHYTALDSDILCSPVAHYVPIFEEIMHSSSLGWLTELETHKVILWTLNHLAQTGFLMSAHITEDCSTLAQLCSFSHTRICTHGPQINLLSCHTRHTQETEAVLSSRLNCPLKPPYSPRSKASRHPVAL